MVGWSGTCSNLGADAGSQACTVTLDQLWPSLSPVSEFFGCEMLVFLDRWWNRS